MGSRAGWGRGIRRPGRSRRGGGWGPGVVPQRRGDPGMTWRERPWPSTSRRWRSDDEAIKGAPAVTQPITILHAHSGNLYGGVETMLGTLARHPGPLVHRFALCYEGRVAGARGGAR